MKRIPVILVSLLGLACTLASAGMSWFAIPVGTLPAADLGEPALQIAEPWATPVFHAAAAVLVVSLLVLWFLGRHTSRAALVAVSVWCVALLFYPYCVMVCDPPIAGNATLLEAAHRNLIWSGGDVNASIEYRIAGAFDKLYLSDAVQEVSPTPMGDWQLSELSLARLPDLFERLGYSNKLFEFIQLGWVAALMGSGLLLVWMCAAEGQLHVPRTRLALTTFSCVFLLTMLLAWGRSFVASGWLASAAEHTARGDYEDALGALERAAAVLPVLHEDTNFIRQTGLLEDALRRDTAAAALYRANVMARDGRHQRAGLIFERLVQQLPLTSPIRREAGGSILRLTINALNAGRSNEAARQLEVVLARDPCNLKALYGLQLAYLRCRRYSDIPPLVARMDAIYRYFQFPNKRAAQYAAHSNSMAADYMRGDPGAAILEARKVLDK